MVQISNVEYFRIRERAHRAIEDTLVDTRDCFEPLVQAHRKHCERERRRCGSALTQLISIPEVWKWLEVSRPPARG